MLQRETWRVLVRRVRKIIEKEILVRSYYRLSFVPCNSVHQRNSDYANCHSMILKMILNRSLKLLCIINDVN